MDYKRFNLGSLGTNCYLLWSGRAAGIIDPGGPVEELIQFIESRQLEPQWIIITHGHADHIVGNQALHDKYEIPVWIHEADRLMLTSTTANLSTFIGKPVVSPEADHYLKDGDLIRLGDENLTVIETPGHTPGGISLYSEGMLFSGDTLFRESIGRTDFPGGNHVQLLQSIREKLFVLPPATQVLPGHEVETTIGYEVKFNPFF